MRSMIVLFLAIVVIEFGLLLAYVKRRRLSATGVQHTGKYLIIPIVICLLFIIYFIMWFLGIG